MRIGNYELCEYRMGAFAVLQSGQVVGRSHRIGRMVDLVERARELDQLMLEERRAQRAIHQVETRTWSYEGGVQ